MITFEELEKHICLNKPDYNSQIIIAALCMKLYNRRPKIGLSGTQAECIDILVADLPSILDGLKK